jgi:hypothetical protein
MRAASLLLARAAIAFAAVTLVGLLSARDAIAAEEIPAGVAAYASALDGFKSAGTGQSIESVFEAGMKVSPSLQAVLPDLSESDYQKVQRQMQGFMVERREVIFVRPIVGYFKELARKRGTKADRAFFDIYERTEPDGASPFPAYSEQQTDEAGCTRFDGKQLVDLYRGWVTFRTSYPDAYATEAQGEIDSLESELLSGICSCVDSAKTAAGLQEFVTAFPDLPITPRIKLRIAAIRSGKSSFRFNCHAGYKGDLDPAA